MSMKLIFKGSFDGNESSLPVKEHEKGAVRVTEIIRTSLKTAIFKSFRHFGFERR